MQISKVQSAAIQSAAQTPTQPAYQAPRVQDLGAWQAVTLINSVPINPGAMFNPNGTPGGNNNGY